MVMDAFKVHFRDDVSAEMLIGHTGVVNVPTRTYILSITLKCRYKRTLQIYPKEITLVLSSVL